jgi:hypothetical protein
MLLKPMNISHVCHMFRNRSFQCVAMATAILTDIKIVIYFNQTKHSKQVLKQT